MICANGSFNFWSSLSQHDECAFKLKEYAFKYVVNKLVLKKCSIEPGDFGRHRFQDQVTHYQR